jgi:hypothetical protein
MGLDFINRGADRLLSELGIVAANVTPATARGNLADDIGDCDTGAFDARHSRHDIRVSGDSWMIVHGLRLRDAIKSASIRTRERLRRVWRLRRVDSP